MKNTSMPATESIPYALSSLLLGMAVGDALGVPVEFSTRSDRTGDPVTDMRGFGAWHQPAGTFSDDTSMALCMVDALREGFSPDAIAQRFLAWRDEGLWAAHGHCFDIGRTTQMALSRISSGLSAQESGGTEVWDNGNGSLMRIAPIVFFIEHLSAEERLERVRLVSAITHAHALSVVACQFLVEYLLALRQGLDKHQALTHVQTTLPGLVPSALQGGVEGLRLAMASNLADRSLDEIASSGYVIDTLEASLWCFLRTETFEDAVLMAVNLGGDTDTTGCVAGAIAGLYYGKSSIPPHWLNTLARADDMEALARA